MAILDINTENRDVSWVIRKNPLTQQEIQRPFKRELRKGDVFSWYVNELNFRSFFKEKSSESSFYKNINNNYLNQSAYNCPYVYCAMINENFSSVLKDPTEKDTVCKNTIVLQQVLVTNMTVVTMFKKHFDLVSIVAEKIENKVYKIIFSSTTTLSYLMKVVHVMCLLLSVEDRNIYIDITESVAKKYAQYLIDIQAPYFIVYLFNSRLIDSFGVFNQVKEIFKHCGWELFYGNTQKQRYDQIKQVLSGGKMLHDIGCGELYYSKNFKDLYDNIVAWDMEDAIQERNEKYITKKSIENIQLRGEFVVDQLECDNTTDLLITEMLEHMPKEKATELLYQINKKRFKRLVITLPNRDFNSFYKLGSEFRHGDHCWEPSFDESVEMMTEVFGKDVVLIKPIGDKINTTSVSTLFVIEKI